MVRPEKKYRNLRALVVGLGSIGTRHLNNLSVLGVQEISAFRIRNLPPPQEVQPLSVQYFTDFSKALLTKPDLVVIANPTAMHLSFALQAIRAGAHVYLEKPISHTLEGVEDFYRESLLLQRIVAVGCQLRAHPTLKIVKDWIVNPHNSEQSAEKIGKILSVRADVGEYLPDWHPYEDYRKSYASQKSLGGGVILTLIHEIDYLYWIFGSINSVYAVGGQMTPLELDVEDNVLMTLDAGGVPIQLRMDYWRKPPVRTLEVVGEKGVIHWNGVTGEALWIKDGDVYKRESVPSSFNRNELFLAMMDNFLCAVESKNTNNHSDAYKLLNPLKEGIDVLKIAMMAKDSMVSKKVFYA